jgi:hypothetical protein
MLCIAYKQEEVIANATRKRVFNEKKYLGIIRFHCKMFIIFAAKHQYFTTVHFVVFEEV